jgi:hypothetical protein
MAAMKRPSPSIIVALIAVVLAAAGAGAASTKLLTGRDIRDGTIAAKDLSPALRAQIQRTGRPGLRGAPGERGPAGPAGANGTPGGFDPAKVTYVSSEQTPLVLANGRDATVSAACPSGSRAISGGLTAISPVLLKASSAAANGSAWTVSIRDEGTPLGFQNVLVALAVCAAP